MTTFFWTTDPQEAEREQIRLRELLLLDHNPDALTFARGLAIGTAYEENTKTAFAVGALFDDTGKLFKQRVTAHAPVEFPYVPGLLAFRVGPAVCRLLDQVSNDVQILLFDGQGIAHPRGLGIASHFGILYDKVAVGVTRNNLYGEFEEPPRARMNSTHLRHPRTKEQIGHVLSLGPECEPCFISPGHRLGVEDALAIVTRIAGDNTCFPRPLRNVHAEANAAGRRYRSTQAQQKN